MHIDIMSNTSDSVIAEVLKLYDMVDEHKITNKVQQLNVVELDGVNLGNSNVLPLEQHVYHNNESVVLGKSAAYIDLKNTINKHYVYYFLQSTKGSSSEGDRG